MPKCDGAILVTGGAGFVGSNLAMAFKAKYPDQEILVLDNLKRRGSEYNLPRLAAAGKPQPKVTTAIARELVGYAWDIARRVSPAVAG